MRLLPLCLLMAAGGGGEATSAPQPLKAYWLTRETIAWDASIPSDATVWLHSGEDLPEPKPGARQPQSAVRLRHATEGLSNDLKQKFPHLAGHAAYRIDPEAAAQAVGWLKGPIAVTARAADGTAIDSTGLQTAGVLDDIHYYGGPLGTVFLSGVPTLRLWAPTARTVKALIFQNSQDADAWAQLPMAEDPENGVWSVVGDPSWNRKFYLYEVEVYSPFTGKVELNRVTDPYSLSLSTDGKRSQIVRLEDADLVPDGWNSLRKPRLDAPEDIVVYELHVRDFSIGDDSVPQPFRGTFKAFSASGSRGMRHLEELSQAGLTHVHLLPVFDIGTVPENRADQLAPEGDLGSFPPDSEKQQEAIEKVKEKDGFNWGYDPVHYTVPEGSYATDPDGPARIREFREMVQSLNRIGLRVVMDVVYNHTHAAGQSERAVLDRIVPGYYHRLDAEGRIATSSCCPNTASEHAMMEKLMIDSVLIWAREYKVDGFRFDLMGHHMKENLLKVRRALDELTLAHDGVDGPRVYVYGEGWDFGEVAGNARGVNAAQANMAGTGIGTFNDRLRDGARGGTPFSNPRDQGFVTGLFYESNGSLQGNEREKLLHYSDWIRLGLAGNLADFEWTGSHGGVISGRELDYLGSPAGYALDPQENIVYVSAHDNETLFDAIQMKASESVTLSDRARMQNLAISITALAQGVPFFHAGVDLLRSKSMDRDSFNSGDWFNKLDFSRQSNNWGVGLPPAEKNRDKWEMMRPLLADPVLKPSRREIEATAAHFKEMLRIRRSSQLFRLRSGDEVKQTVRFLNTGPAQIAGAIVMVLQAEASDETVVVVFNALPARFEFSAPQWKGRGLRLHPEQTDSADAVVRESRYDEAAGTFIVPARSAAVFVSEP